MTAYKQSKKQISLSTSKALQAFGLVIMLFSITLFYLSNSIFLDKILLCSLIIGMALFPKMLGKNKENEPSSGKQL